MKKSILVFFLFMPIIVLSQGRGDTWCFGDSIRMKFSGGNLIPDSFSSVFSIEENTSISNEAGDLLFYVAPNYFHSIGWPLTLTIWNKNNQVMQNGDSLSGSGTETNGLIIIPSTSDPNRYYVFSIDPGNFYAGLYCSVVDMSFNGGLGEVVIRDSMIINCRLSEKLSAVKHANGTDWWLVVHKMVQSDSTNVYYKLLIDSSGINFPDSQSIGTNYSLPGNFSRGLVGEMSFSNDGSRLAAVGFGMIDLFDFNRCTGELSNWTSLGMSNPNYPNDTYYGTSFSPDATKFYITSGSDGGAIGHVYQFDLNAGNILASRMDLYTSPSPDIYLGQMELGSNGKIYIASGLGFFPIATDTLYNLNLSVINQPDSLGLGCDLQMFSVPIATGKSYAGLPNIPNYYLGSLEINCDSITNIPEASNFFQTLTAIPNPSTGVFHIESKEKIEAVEVFNYTGESILFSKGPLQEIDLRKAVSGIYFLRVRTQNGVTTIKLLRQ